ncbi:MAG: DUF4340 domain-containing protein [Deltaproteobacteria bacterium]|nr:DUF4340 domain-containing protein [Deltaproteobacteria bacterium]
MQLKHRPYWYLLFAIAFAGVVLWIERPDRESIRVAESQPLFAGLQSEQIARIEIEQLLDGVQLVRDGTQWMIRPLTSTLKASVTEAEAQPTADAPETVSAAPASPADATLIASALETLTKLEVGGVASRNPDAHDKLQVGKLALQVRAFDAAGKALASLRIGGQGPDFLSSYVRAGDAPNVYLVRQQLRSHFPTRLAPWRDKVIWKLDPDLITSVQLDRKTGNLAIAKQPDGLFARSDVATPTPLDAAKLREWFSGWTGLNAVEIAETADPKTTGLDDTKDRLIVKLQDGTERMLLLGKAATHGSYFAKLADRDTVFVLPTTFQSVMTADVAQWVPAAEPPASTAESSAPVAE